MNKLALPALILLLPAIFAPLSLALPIRAASDLTLANRSCDDGAWVAWKTEHDKVYASQQEDAERCRVFM